MTEKYEIHQKTWFGENYKERMVALMALFLLASDNKERRLHIPEALELFKEMAENTPLLGFNLWEFEAFMKFTSSVLGYARMIDPDKVGTIKRYAKTIINRTSGLETDKP